MWLDKKRGDLTTGTLYPYVGAKQTYLCPTDAREIAAQKRPSWAKAAATAPTGGGQANAITAMR
jgi:hypothetical protein